MLWTLGSGAEGDGRREAHCGDQPTTVITGLDPVIQGDRSIACSGPSARGPRVTGGGRRTRIAPSLSQRLRQPGELVGDLAPPSWQPTFSFATQPSAAHFRPRAGYRSVDRVSGQ